MRTSITVFLLALVLVSAQPRWQVLKPDYEPVLVGISFLDENVGFMSGGQNGEPPVGGPQVYKSLDGGVTWQWLPHSGFAMMFLDVAMDTKTNGVTAGVGIVVVPGIEYTITGNNFNKTLEVELIDECQSTEVIKGVPGGFGLAGDFDKSNGAAVSFDRGMHFVHYDANLTTIARYGSYPNRNTWYISAGDWPGRKNKVPGVKQLTQHISIITEQDENTKVIRNSFRFNTEPVNDPNPNYDCNIAKTTDGGKSWQMLFKTEDFYPNGISCPTPTSCWVVAEADHHSPIGEGIHILHTADGGKTWETQLRNTNPHFSLIALDMLNEQEGWAGGGELAATHITGHFWHTVNGGKNWTLETVPGVYPNDFSFVNRNRGWATAFTIHGDSAVLAYK